MIHGRTLDQIACDDANAPAAHAGRYRQMDTSLGRWTRQDPIGYWDGGSVYQSLKSNPLNFTDPLGLLSLAPPSWESVIGDIVDILKGTLSEEIQKLSESIGTTMTNVAGASEILESIKCEYPMQTVERSGTHTLTVNVVQPITITGGLNGVRVTLADLDATITLTIPISWTATYTCCGDCDGVSPKLTKLTIGVNNVTASANLAFNAVLGVYSDSAATTPPLDLPLPPFSPTNTVFEDDCY